MTTRMNGWILTLVVFSVASTVEGIGVSQIFAFLPLDLQQMGLPRPDVAHWVGILSSLVFVLGLPLVPLWGVWADKYTRKGVILRSALVEAVVFSLVAASRQPWQLAASLLLVGFQLGNTGVMLAAIREVTPKPRLGTAIALFGATSPVGFAIGPALGGLLVDGWHASISDVFALSAALSLLSAAFLVVGFHEVRPSTIPTGRVWDLAFGALRGVVAEPVTRRLFLLFGVTFLARQMATPFVPLVVERVNASPQGVASAIALVVGTAALIGGLISPIAGTIGDKIGFRVVLTVALLGAGVSLCLVPFAPSVPWLATISVGSSALNAAVSAMVFALLSIEVPAERRSATLNLVYLPLYLAGIVGPAIGSIVVGLGLAAVFYVAGVILILYAAAEGYHFRSRSRTA